MPTLALTGVSSTGQIALIGAPGLVALAPPAPRLAISGEGAVPLEQLVLPVPVLDLSGTGGVSGGIELDLPAPRLVYGPATVDLDLPVPVLAIGGDSGLVGSLGLTLPAPVVAVAGPSGVQLKLPVPALQLGGGVGVIGGVVLALPVPQPAASVDVPYTGQVALTLPAVKLALAGSAGVAGSVAVTLRGIALALEGGTGVIGEAALTLPVSVFAASGYENTGGSVQLVLPHLQIVATGGQSSAAGPATGTASTLVMHTEQMGLTTYSNFPFNSFAAFNGVFLAASPSGIFTLGGATDNGAIIQAAARVGITDFATSYLKRVDRVYVGYRTDGNLVLRVFTDEVTQRDYLLTATGKSGLHGNHARLGKGLAARYWQFEVRNQDGADFQLNMIELKPVKLKRRVGGGDA